MKTEVEKMDGTEVKNGTDELLEEDVLLIVNRLPYAVDFDKVDRNKDHRAIMCGNCHAYNWTLCRCALTGEFRIMLESCGQPIGEEREA